MTCLGQSFFSPVTFFGATRDNFGKSARDSEKVPNQYVDKKEYKLDAGYIVPKSILLSPVKMYLSSVSCSLHYHTSHEWNFTPPQLELKLQA